MPETQGQQYAVAIILTVAASVFVGLRFYCRRKLKLQLLADDWLIVPALIFTWVLGLLMIIAAAIGHLGQHTEIGEHGPVEDDKLYHFSQILFVNQIVQLLAVGPTKLSVLWFYRRIFAGVWFNRLSWLLIGLTIFWTVAFFFTNLFQCADLSDSWWKLGRGNRCLDEVPMYLAQAYSDVIMDFLILILPIPWIWGLHMKTRTKVAITGLFLLGALTIAASCAKMVIQYFVGSHLAGKPDLTYYLTPIVYWPMVEASLGIIAACLPTLRPLLKGWSLEHFVANLRSTFTLRSTTGSSKWGSTGGTRDVDVESTGSSSRGIYQPSKLETHIEIVPLEQLRVGGRETKPDVIMVRKCVDRVDEPL